MYSPIKDLGVRSATSVKRINIFTKTKLNIWDILVNQKQSIFRIEN